MAADRVKTTLMIALIIAVMIAFILSVTTYLGFQQKGKEEQSAQAARSEMEKANRERAAAVDEAQRVREVLGTDKDTADAVEAERNELFDRKFAAFDKEPKSLLRLVEWLADAIKAKDDQLAAKNTEVKQANDRAAAAESEKDRIATEAKAAREAADENVRKVTEDFKTRWAEHEQAQQGMKAKQDEALGQAERMRAITEELAKLGPLLSPELQRKFAANPPDNQPAPWPERVRLVFSELKARERREKELNATLSRLRVADPELQKLVRDATPKDDRIDGFDGRIASVNSFDRSVLLLCDSTAGMRPGLLLSVYAPDDPRPRSGTRKGQVEVIGVEGPTLARARVIDDSATTPILAGDGVATSLWAPGGGQEVTVVGYVRFGSDRKQGTAALEAAVGRSGARIVDTVTPQTTLVVDAGLPAAADVQGGSVKDWRKAEETIRENALTRARELGIRVVTLDGLLDMLGLDRESLDGRRLPDAAGVAP